MTPRSAWLALSLTLALLAPGFSQAADAVRGGKLAYVEAVGQRDPSQPAPMKVDDIFRIYSMT